MLGYSVSDRFHLDFLREEFELLKGSFLPARNTEKCKD